MNGKLVQAIVCDIRWSKKDEGKILNRSYGIENGATILFNDVVKLMHHSIPYLDKRSPRKKKFFNVPPIGI